VQLLWFSGTRSVSATAPLPPALTSQQRRAAIEAQADGALYPWIFIPAAQPILDFCTRRPFVGAAHLFALSVTSGALAGLFLIGGGSHPLLRFWAGIFLVGCEALSLAAGRLPRGQIFSLRTTRAVQTGIATVAVLLSLVGTAYAATAIEPSVWTWLLGLAAIVSAPLQAFAFDGMRTEYVIGAGGGAPELRDNLLEMSIRTHDALLRGEHVRAKLWRWYAALRQNQQAFVSAAPRGSADAFWRLNRRRISVWTLVSPGAHLFCISAGAVLSAFWPDALIGVLWLIGAGGSVLAAVLLRLGWKTER
jgi:hypothetical protein